MIIPELPDYLTSLGGEDYKGYIIGLFTITAGLSRPFSGKLTDKVGRIPVMVIGAFTCFIIGFIYPLVTTAFGFLLLRFLHGFSTGFKPTGTVAYIADLVPANKRGEAMGLTGMFGTTGVSLGYYIGSPIAQTYSLEVLFYCSSISAIISVLILVRMKETLQNREKFNLSHLKIGREDIYEPTVILPTLIMILSYFSFGTVLTLIPDFSKHLGLENKGAFVGVFTASSILVRFFAGKASDKYGRPIVLIVAMSLFLISMVMVGFATEPILFFSGSVVFGLAMGMNSPTIFAWTTDLSPEKYRGRGMSTVFIGLEIGIMSGSFYSAWIYDNNPSNFPVAFISAAVMVIIALFFLIMEIRKKSNT